MTAPDSGQNSSPKTPVTWETIDLVRRHESIANRRGFAIAVIDVQERLLPTMSREKETLGRIGFLVDAAAILGLPVLCTEQYPKGLGPTSAGLLARLGNAPRFEKSTFSAAGCAGFLEHLGKLGIRDIALAGIEAHVCIAQSALDLSALGYRVRIPADAVTSRSETDRSFALERLRAEGVTVTTAEAMVFELLETSGTPEFKKVLELLK